MLYDFGGYLYDDGKDDVYVSDLNKYLASSEISEDLLSGKLQLADFEGTNTKEILTFIKSGSISAFRISNINEYIAYVNKKRSNRHFMSILENYHTLTQKMDNLTDLVVQLRGELSILRKEVSKPTEITLREVWKDIFPTYKLPSLRNILSRNRYEKDGYWVSHLKIENFDLTFRRTMGAKEWKAFRVDYVPQKTKTYDYNFKEKLRKRGV